MTTGIPSDRRRSRPQTTIARTILAIACAGLAATAAAQPAPPGRTGSMITLTDAIAEAESHAPALQAVASQTRAAEWRASAASRARFGQVDGVLSYSRYQDDQIVRPMARELFGPRGFLGLPFDNDQLHYGVVFQVPLYTGGRIGASSRVAQLEADQAALLVEGTRWEVRQNVAALYATVQSLDVVARAVDANIAALDATGRRLTLAVEEGKRPRLDLLKVQEELADAHARRAMVAADGARARAVLLAVLGRHPSGDLAVEPLGETEPQWIVPESGLLALVQGSSYVRRGEFQVDQAEQTVGVARAALRPSVVARGNLLGNSGLSIDEHLSTWELSVAATVPLFNGGAQRAQLAAAGEAARAAAAGATGTALEREAILVEAQARLRAAREGIQAARSRIVSATEAARIEQLRYDSGAGAIDDLLRARAREESSAAAVAQARGDLAAAIARLNAVCEKEVIQ